MLLTKPRLRPQAGSAVKQVTQFTCFTSTEVQILTCSVFEDGESGAEEAGDLKGFGTQFTCFTSTKVQILTARVARRKLEISRASVLTLLAALVQKYKY